MFDPAGVSSTRWSTVYRFWSGWSGKQFFLWNKGIWNFCRTTKLKTFTSHLEDSSWGSKYETREKGHATINATIGFKVTSDWLKKWRKFYLNQWKSVVQGNPVYTGPDRFLNWQKRIRLSFTRDLGMLASFWMANSIAICHRIGTVPCKRVAQVKNLSRPVWTRLKVLFSLTLVVETFRFLDEKDYEYEILLKFFSRLLKL